MACFVGLEAHIVACARQPEDTQTKKKNCLHKTETGMLGLASFLILGKGAPSQTAVQPLPSFLFSYTPTPQPGNTKCTNTKQVPLVPTGSTMDVFYCWRIIDYRCNFKPFTTACSTGSGPCNVTVTLKARRERWTLE